MLLTKGDLRLLEEQLGRLARTPYFYGALDGYLDRLRATAAGLLDQFNSVPPEISRALIKQIWTASRFLAGSTSREIPYEIVYALHLALEDWIGDRSKKLVITTALLDERGYYFWGIDSIFYDIVEQLLDIKFEHDIVQVALPRLYKHRPIHNAALYHELGHFVEARFSVASRALLLFPLEVQQSLSKEYLAIFHQHLREHFADLFAASYVGDAISRILSEFAGGERASATHPAMQDRLDLISAFLEGRAHNIVTLVQTSLQLQQLSPLTPRFCLSDLKPTFGNIRPHRISDDAEVHGLLVSACKFLDDILAAPLPAWTEIAEHDMVRIVNDLLEKSVRNRMVEAGWNDAAATQAEASGVA